MQRGIRPALPTGALVLALALAGAAAPTRAQERGPSPTFQGPQTTRPARSYPRAVTYPEPYARTWDAITAVLGSRGFPIAALSRESGLVTTSWRVTQPHHRALVGTQPFIGRKVERLTLLVRPVRGGTEVFVSSQTALVSPQWSAAGMPPAGQAVDIESDTVTEYGVLHDVARVLGFRLSSPPDTAYGLGLESGGIFGSSLKLPARESGAVRAPPPDPAAAAEPTAPSEPAAATEPPLPPPPLPSQPEAAP